MSHGFAQGIHQGKKISRKDGSNMCVVEIFGSNGCNWTEQDIWVGDNLLGVFFNEESF